MARIVKHAPTSYCPKCKGESQAQAWLPEAGLDPRLREFQCNDCGSLFFIVIKNLKRLGQISISLGQGADSERQNGAPGSERTFMTYTRVREADIPGAFGQG